MKSQRKSNVRITLLSSFTKEVKKPQDTFNICINFYVPDIHIIFVSAVNQSGNI